MRYTNPRLYFTFYMPPASLDWQKRKNSILFAESVAFVCFYDACAFCLRQLSFLFTSLGKGRGRVKGEGRVDEERGREGKVIEGGK